MNIISIAIFYVPIIIIIIVVVVVVVVIVIIIIILYCVPVLSNLFHPAGRTRQNHEAAGRTSKLKSND